MQTVRYVLEYKGGSIQLPQGETTVGRALACAIRFNDPAVSRKHLLIKVEGEKVTALELSATNPTRINGHSLHGSAELKHDDVVEFGQTWFRIALISEEEEEDQTHPGAVDDDLTPPPLPMPPVKPPASNLSDAIFATTNVVSGLPLPQLKTQNCPQCRAKVPAIVDVCPDCNYQWPKGRPTSVTQRLDTRALKKLRKKHSGRERREHLRVPIDLPMIYDSELLTFDATARDISLGGLFVATELLDDMGTECKVTILPDGAAAIPIKGIVCWAVTVGDESGRPPGMGIKFVAIGMDAKVWISSLLMKARTIIGPESGKSSDPKDPQ